MLLTGLPHLVPFEPPRPRRIHHARGGENPRWQRDGRYRYSAPGRSDEISNRGKTSGGSGCQAGSADEFREVGDGSVSGDIEPGAEIIPEGDAELGAGFGEAEEGIPAVASGIAAGAAADFAFGDVAADVVFGAVGVEWDLRVIEHHQQFGFIGMQPGEQSIEGGKAGLALKDPVEA